MIQSGVDLIAKEAEYHRSCRAKFLVETASGGSPCASEKRTPQSFHSDSFSWLCNYIRSAVIENQQSVLVSALLDMYKLQYTSIGGLTSDVANNAAQNLLRKVNVEFGPQINVALADQQKGNFIFSAAVTEDDAKLTLFNDSELQQQDDRLRWAALHLRSVIMQLPKSKTPNPANVQNLKACASEIPRQVDLFFRYLLGDVTPSFPCENKDTVDRKVTCMASDAIYNVTHGTVKPWKHTALGLGLASLTGSK